MLEHTAASRDSPVPVSSPQLPLRPSHKRCTSLFKGKEKRLQVLRWCVSFAQWKAESSGDAGRPTRCSSWGRALNAARVCWGGFTAESPWWLAIGSGKWKKVSVTANKQGQSPPLFLKIFRSRPWTGSMFVTRALFSATWALCANPTWSRCQNCSTYLTLQLRWKTNVFCTYLFSFKQNQSTSEQGLWLLHVWRHLYIDVTLQSVVGSLLTCPDVSGRTIRLCAGEAAKLLMFCAKKETQLSNLKGK